MATLPYLLPVCLPLYVLHWQCISATPQHARRHKHMYTHSDSRQAGHVTPFQGRLEQAFFSTTSLPHSQPVQNLARVKWMRFFTRFSNASFWPSCFVRIVRTGLSLRALALPPTLSRWPNFSRLCRFGRERLFSCPFCPARPKRFLSEVVPSWVTGCVHARRKIHPLPDAY